MDWTGRLLQRHVKTALGQHRTSNDIWSQLRMWETHWLRLVYTVSRVHADKCTLHNEEQREDSHPWAQKNLLTGAIREVSACWAPSQWSLRKRRSYPLHCTILCGYTRKRLRYINTITASAGKKSAWGRIRPGLRQSEVLKLMPRI